MPASMRRLTRHLFTLCSALSLLLCVAVCVLWVRSYWSASTITYTSFATDNPGAYRRIIYEVASMSGHLVVERSDVQVELEAPGGLSVYGQHDFLRRRPRLTFANQLGFYYMDDPGGRGTLTRYVVPTWAVVLPLSLPAGWFVLRQLQRRVREKRAARCQCPSCGYDLRASPARCPECGTPALPRTEKVNQ
jgi:4-amino-4-deoxy-L-arabinose transferase-like glycosyltransferase